MKKRVLITLLLLISFIRANSQEFNFGFQTGIGTYSMKGLKNINTSVPQGLPFDTKLVADFPAYFYYRPSMILRFKGFGLGLVYSFQSTGSRISAKDYSGEYRFDMKVRSSAPGIYCEVKLTAENNFNFYLYSIIGPSFSNLETKEYFNVADTMLINANYKFKAQNYYIEPGINILFPVKAFSFGLNFGYLVQFGDQAFYTGNDKKNILFDAKNQVSVKPDWNGIRGGLSVFYNLSN
ncbi:MAG: hypothetical protein ABR927_08925 [Bacteroidales bacterium]